MSRLDTVSLAKQAAMGTKQTVMEYTVPVESCEPRLQRTEMTAEETDGTKFPTDLEYGSRFFEVPMVGKARVTSIPRVLSGFLGAPTTIAAPGGTGTAKKHQFDPVGKTLVPHSIDVARRDPNPVINDLYWDAIGNELSLGVAPNDWIEFNAGWIARDLDQAQSAPVVTHDLSRRLAFHTFQAFISVNGAGEVALPLGSFSLRYSNNVATDQPQLGSRSLYKVQEGNVTADVTFAVKSTLSAHYRRAVQDADPDAVKIRLLATGPLIEGTASYSIELIVYRCQYLDAPAPVNAGNTLDDLTVTARAAYDITNTKFVDVNVVNNVASY